MLLLPYTINFSSDALKTPITIQPGQVNEDSTSLKLPGKGRVDYGEYYNENLIHLLEHFPGPNEPHAPTIGQVWYNTSATPNALFVFTGTGIDAGWIRIMTTGNTDRFHVPDVDLLPTTDLVAGDIVYHNATKKLYVCATLNNGTKQWFALATEEWSETQLIVDGGTVAFA